MSSGPQVVLPLSHLPRPSDVLRKDPIHAGLVHAVAKADLEFHILLTAEITGGLHCTRLTLYGSGEEMCPLFPEMGEGRSL